MILVSINFTTLAYSFSSHVCGESTLCALYVHSMCKLYVHPMCTLCALYVHSMCSRQTYSRTNITNDTITKKKLRFRSTITLQCIINCTPCIPVFLLIH